MDESTNRILLYVTYDPYDTIGSHVVFQLNSLRPYFKKIILIRNLVNNVLNSNFNIDAVDHVIKRRNIGYDFSAWKEGLDYIHANGIDYDWIVLMNDSCFGPLSDMGPVFEILEKPGFDFYGITNNKVAAIVPEHIQSYFMGFSRNICKADVFTDFWKECEPLRNIDDVIKKYETRLTEKLMGFGFKYKVLVDAIEDVRNPDNMTIRLPIELIALGSPFIKVKAFSYFPQPRWLLQKIKELGSYPDKLIIDYFNARANPNENPFIGYQLVDEDCINSNIKDVALRVAVHIHVFYVELFEIFWKAFCSLGNIDIYITTDTDGKRNEIQKIIQNECLQEIKYVIKITPNRGRDIMPWLTAFPEIHKYYDIVGHFHTKKTPHASRWLGQLWLDEIFDAIINNYERVLGNFEQNERLGIIIPEIPTYFIENHTVNHWGDNKEALNKLWQKMNLPKNLDFSTLNTPIMPYGSMFWYRPRALRQLFELTWEDNDFALEPIPADGALVHAIERLPVYLAWANGYDYRISLPLNRRVSAYRTLELRWKTIHEKKRKKKGIKYYTLLFVPPIIVKSLGYVKRKLESLMRK